MKTTNQSRDISQPFSKLRHLFFNFAPTVFINLVQGLEHVPAVFNAEQRALMANRRVAITAKDA